MKDRKTSPEPRIMGRKLREKKKRVSSESEKKNTLKALSKQFFSVLGNSFQLCICEVPDNNNKCRFQRKGEDRNEGPGESEGEQAKK